MKKKNYKKHFKIAKLHIDKILDYDSTNIKNNLEKAIINLMDAYLLIYKSK